MPEPTTTAAKPSNNMSADDHSHGLLALSPAVLAFLVLVCGTAYCIFTVLQITSTEQSVFGLLQIASSVNPGATAAQVQEFINGSLDRNHIIANAIGWGVQIALLMLSFPPDAALLAMHKKYNGPSASSFTKVAASAAKWRQFMMNVLIGGDILTDFFYVVQGHTLFVMNGILPSSVNLGVVLIGIVYPVAICFVTIYVGKYLFTFGDALFDRLRGVK